MAEEPVQETKERLFLAAVKVFARSGYKGATIREICQLAGAANINAINYYYGGKEKLYKTILDAMFSAYQKRKETKQSGGEQKKKSPEERLRNYIETYCNILFSEADVAREMTAIFTAEMSRPSPYLNEMVQKYMIPESEEIMGIVRDILGRKTSFSIVLDSAVSVIGQITYYSFAWPMFSRAVPNHPPLEHYRTDLVDHVYRFSLGGLSAVKKSLASDKQAATFRSEKAKKSR